MPGHGLNFIIRDITLHIQGELCPAIATLMWLNTSEIVFGEIECRL